MNSSEKICPICSSQAFIEVEESIVCSLCGSEFEDEEKVQYFNPETNLPLSTPNFVSRKRNITSLRDHKKREDFEEKFENHGNPLEYLEAFQFILQKNGKEAKDAFKMNEEFIPELKKTWFEYLENWEKSGKEFEGSFIKESSKGLKKKAKKDKKKKS
jgi:hypothetical protein